MTHIDHIDTGFAILLATTHDLGITSATGQLGPPLQQKARRHDAPAEAFQVVQPDPWERPRSPQAPQPTEREPAIGDRVVIRQGRRASSAFVGQTGTVVEIFRVPRDSCVVSIDGDDAGQPGLFCYHDEVVLCAT